MRDLAQDADFALIGRDGELVHASVGLDTESTSIDFERGVPTIPWWAIAGAVLVVGVVLVLVLRK